MATKSYHTWKCFNRQDLKQDFRIKINEKDLPSKHLQTCAINFILMDSGFSSKNTSCHFRYNSNHNMMNETSPLWDQELLWKVRIQKGALSENIRCARVCQQNVKSSPLATLAKFNCSAGRCQSLGTTLNNTRCL